VPTRARYDRIAPVYDLAQGFLELPVRYCRQDLWASVGAGQVLEVGVGTGKNIRFYPPDAAVTAIDLSPKMLDRARSKARQRQSRVRLQLADVQRLPYQDQRFDAVVGTFVFFAVPDPILALGEVRRVLKPGGKLLLLEHVLSERRFLRGLMKGLDPVAALLWGAHVNRDTVGQVRAAGFAGVRSENLALDIIRRIEATAPQ
jgi:ubiquinone/menaquinone biosynthesis C-methylase UbiE